MLPSSTTLQPDAPGLLVELRQLRHQLPQLVRPEPFAQETTGFRPYTGQGGILADLRRLRDRTLLDTLANNIFQRAAAPILTPAAGILEKLPVGARPSLGQAADIALTGPVPGQARTSTLNVLANLAKGITRGMILLPDDAAVEPTDPMPALQSAGVFLGAGAEGLIADYALLSSLGVVRAVAAARGATRTAASADAALRLFGQGESRTVFEKAMGGALLGGASEIGLQAGALQDPARILAASGIVTLAGAAVGGAIAGTSLSTRRLLASPRVGKTLGEGEALAETIARQEEFEKGVVLGPPRAAERGVGPQTTTIDMLDTASEARRRSVRLGERGAVGTSATLPPDLPKMDAPELEALFDQKAGLGFREQLGQKMAELRSKWETSFVYEAPVRHLPSTTGIAGLSLADDLRRLRHLLNRADRLASQTLNKIVAPLEGVAKDSYPTAAKAFVRLAILRDLGETADRLLTLPGGVSEDVVKRNLSRLEAAAPREVVLAAEQHRAVVNDMRQELMRRGKLPLGSGYENYYPHQMIEDLALDDAYTTGKALLEAEPTGPGRRGAALTEPRRAYTKQRAGSTRLIDTNYLEVMSRALRRFHADNALDDFITEVGKKFSLNRAQLDPEMLRGLERSGRFQWSDGVEYKLFRPRGPGYYRTEVIGERAWNVLETKLREGVPIDPGEIPELKEIVALGRGKEFLLPTSLADRLEQFYTPDPLAGKILSLRGANAEWKRNTIYWGGARFSIFQLLGDSTNLLRSNPAAFFQFRNSRPDSPLLRALNEQFKKYGTPTISGDQALLAFTGGAGMLSIDVALESDNPSTLRMVGSLLAGAGLGYLLGTNYLRGTLRGGSAIYDLADELGAVNSGFIASTEALAQRTLGPRAPAWPGAKGSLMQRGMDTVQTLLTGKIHGNPFEWTRVPAHIVETVQLERENWMRLASFMQMVERGTPPELAAKRASESLVDYLKFTEYENRYLRGFWLPFYGFYRQNIPNWIKAAAGRDVGGKATIAALSLATIASADIAVQVWNEQFFPEVEKRITERRRKEFHIIVGNPATGEAYQDVKGRPMIVGWEMPYEQALEFFGLARPGYIFSTLFGIAGEKANASLVDQAKKTAADFALGKGMRDYAIQLLTPFIKEPLQLAINKDLFFDSAILPERYWSTAEGRKRAAKHVANTFFRQWREAKRTASQITGRRFNPLTSAFGLGLPISSLDIDREMVGFLHEEMDAVESATRRERSKWMTKLDDLIYSRKDLSQESPGERDKAREIISGAGLDDYEAAAAVRYYLRRAFTTEIHRRLESLSAMERKKLWDALPDFGRTALIFYLNSPGGLFEQPEEGLSILGK